MSFGWLRAACRLTLTLYPEGWRVRYGPELEEVLDQRAVTPFTLLDLAASALHAHRHPELAPTEVLSMSARQRTSVISILVATVIFSVAWAAVLSVRDPLPPWLVATEHHADLGLIIGVVQLAGAAALLAILVGGLVLLASATIRSRAARGTTRPLGLALLSFAAFLGLLAAAGLGLFEPLNAAVGSGPSSLVWVFALLGCVVAGVVGVAGAVRQTAPDPAALRLSLVLGWAGVVAMAFAAIGSLWLIVAVSTEAPDVAAPPLPVILLAAAAGWAAASLRHVRYVTPRPLGS